MKVQALLRATIFAIIVAMITSAVWFFYATTSVAPQIDNGAALVNKMLNSSDKTRDKLKITKHFVVDNTFIGFILANKTNPAQPIGIIYTDRTGHYLVNGNAVVNIDKQQTLYDYGFSHFIQSKQAKTLASILPKSHYVEQGNTNAPHKVWVLIDPNCIFCHKTFAALQPEIKSGELAVRWVILGFLKPSSEGKAAAILNAKDQIAALQENEANFNEAKEEGGIPPLTTIPKAVSQQLKSNLDLLKNNDITVATPTFVYQNAGIQRMHQGYPGEGEKLKALVTSASSKF